MKKRLLSAALALAMVLTMLPLTVFAAYLEEGTTQPTENGKTTVTYYATANSDQGVKGPGWYWMETIKNADNTTDYKYHKVTTGVISGVGNSGTWYSSPVYQLANGDYTCLDRFTLLANATLGDHYLTKNLTVDLNGYKLTWTTNPGHVTGLTLTDKLHTSTSGTSRSGHLVVNGKTLTQKDGSKTNFTLNATNVQIDAINLDTEASHSVTLNNCVVGNINMKGKDDNSLHQGLSWNGGTLWGNIEVACNNANITLNNVVKGTTGSPGDVTLKGTNTQLNVQGGTEINDVKLEGITTGANVTSRPGNVTVNAGCTVNSIALNNAANEKCTGQQTISIYGTVTKGITLTNAAVTVNGGSAKVTEAIKVDTGTVTVSGERAQAIGGVELKRDATFNLTGKNCTVGKLALDSGATAATVTFNVNTEPSNKIAEIDGSYKKATINGGTWTTKAVHTEALNTSLIYQLAKGTTGTTYTYYNADQLGEAIMTQSNVPANKLTVVGQVEAEATQKLSFLNGATVWGYMNVKPGTVIPKLPTSVNNISTPQWTDGTMSPKGGGRYATPESGNAVELNASGGAVSGDVTKITKATVKSGSNNVYDITAAVSGNTISLSGAVPPGQTNFTLELETDAIKKSADGTKDETVVLTLTVKYNPSDKSLIFANTTLTNGVTLENTFDAIKLANGTRYTLNGSRLTVRTATIEVAKETGKTYPVSDYTYIEVNVSAPGYTASDTLKQQVINAINKTGAGFDWTKSPAVLQSINAALATITPQQVSQWITTTQQRAWRENDRGTWNNTTSPDKTAYKDKVWLVPYLQVNVTDFKPNGSMTATLTPMWRVEVHPETGNLYKVKDKTGEAKNGILIVKSGTALTGISGSLTKEDGTGGVEITFKDGLYAGRAAWAHQDNTYDYGVGSNSGKFTVTHAGRSNGLGTFVFDNVMPMIKLAKSQTDTARIGSYSTLQAAVDDATEGQYIVVDKDYSGSTTINMTGKARTIYVQANGKNIVVANASGGLAEYNENGTLYTIKLNRNTEVIVTANVSVAGATGGSASVNTTTAKPGDRITISLSASTGYAPSGVSVRTSSGQSVSVSGSGSSYSFTMPAGATSVTVTPSFVRTTTLPFTDVATTAWYYNGVEYCYNTIRGSARLMQGMSTTSFGPNSGFTRAQVVQILWNIKGCPEPKTTYNPYTDISSIHYAYKAMLWATQNGYAEGYVDNGVRTFRPNQNVTRQEMAVFLWRAAGKPTNYNSLNLNAYADGYMVYDWAQPAMRWAIARGVLSGQSSVALGNYLSPRSVAYRSEVAVTVMNFDKLAVFR